MFTFPDAPGDGKGSAEVGPAPYHHRSDRPVGLQHLPETRRAQDRISPAGCLAGEYIGAATGVQRVYLLALMERAPHFHLWLVPKKDMGELRGMALHGPTASNDRLAE
jgi:hypothetical protein